MNDCYLAEVFDCRESGKELTSAGPDRIRKIMDSSKRRQDSIHIDLEKKLSDNENLKIKCHRSCVSSYTSSYHISRYLKRAGTAHDSSEPPPIKRTRRSEAMQFDFRENCLFCGEKCVLHPDPRHPNRWRKALLCRTADRPGRKTFKEAILEVCDSRKDEFAKQVEVRIMGAISDLHAADARYHDDCRKSFMSSRSIASASKECAQLVDRAFDSTVSEMKSDTSHVWSSVELHKAYIAHGGTILSRGKLVKQLAEMLSEEIVVFSSPGLANILLFRSTASDLLRLVELEEDDKSTEVVAKQVVKECKEFTDSRKVYNARIDKAIAAEEASPTLLSLLSNISEKLQNTLPALLIGNMITSIVTNRPTSLQIALGVQTREKGKIESLHDFGVTCSYDEVLRFKASAATSAAYDINNSLRAITDARFGLIQAVADNFDANISSQNGLRSTHALALLLTQEKQIADNMENQTEEINRIKKEDMKKQVTSDVQIKHYHGPKKPNMPESEGIRAVLPLKVLAEQIIVRRRAQDLDFEFFKSVACVPKTPEFGGFNTRLAREQNQGVKPATTAMYTPLIDMVPSDPDTMMTAMCEAQRLTVKCGQSFTVFTADQQLYRVMVNVIWVHPELFPNFIPRLGGMHMLMSFVGCVGVLMSNTGLEEVLKSAFGGVARMLTGKNFPQNVRALRIVCEELLREFIQDTESYDDLMQMLEARAAQSRTTKLWLDCLIKPVLIMMLFVRAEREAEWALHLYAVNLMMPYFFAAGHVNYARYGLYYLRSMERLPEDVQARFRNGEHVMRHKAGLWNGIWSDMFIETTFMRYGHGPGGLIGITLSPSALKRWALSLHTCSRLLKDLDDMRDINDSLQVTTHKEEAVARIASDEADRKNIRDRLDTCVDPLNTKDHPDGILHIVSGRISPDSVNVDDAVNIGRKQMTAYERSWPESFNGPLSNNVVTMAVSKKSVKCGTGAVYDTQLIYSRVMGLVSTGHVDLKDVFSHELAPLPTSMFDDNGNMRIATTKSMLKKKLQVVKSARALLKPDVIIIDGCAILWCIHWPANGTIQDFVDNFWRYVSYQLNTCDVYLIFDRYYEYSIKSDTRNSRMNEKAGIVHKFKLTTPLPAQQTVLTNTENKVQLIDMICTQLKGKAMSIPENEKGFSHKFVITGSSDVPQEINLGVAIDRMDMRTSHEEADVIIPQQVVYTASQGANTVKVICDDTDVFVLLLHYYALKELTCSLLMEGTSAERIVIDIAATVKKHLAIVPQLLAAHALSGCDTVAKLNGLGKATVVNKLQKGYKLEKLGDRHVDIHEVIVEATRFVAACYGRKGNGSMSDVRYDVWLVKTGNKKIKKTPKLQSLPPTSESFSENVKRAHLQTCIWKSALDADPPNLDPTLFGWLKDKTCKVLTPVTLPADKAPAPASVLQMICCGCSSDQPCATARCGCYAAQLACTVFCNCFLSSNCQNRWTKVATETASDEENNDTDNELDE